MTSCFATDASDHESTGDALRICAVAHQAMWAAIREAAVDTAEHDAGETAAAATAAHDVLAALAPANRGAWRKQLDVHLAGLPPDEQTVRARQIGAAAATRALQEFPTRPCTPLVLRSAQQISAPPPLRLSARGVTSAFRSRREFHALVERYRAEGPAGRRDEGEGPVVFWNRVARAFAEQSALDLPARARLFALLNTALADAWLAADAARTRYAAAQEVPTTVVTDEVLALPSCGPGGATRWDELIATTITIPATPNYPSTTAAMAGAAAAVIRTMGKDPWWALALATADAPRASEPSFALAPVVRHAALARVYAGTECIEAAIAGYDQGCAVGRWIAGRRCFRAEP